MVKIKKVLVTVLALMMICGVAMPVYAIDESLEEYQNLMIALNSRSTQYVTDTYYLPSTSGTSSIRCFFSLAYDYDTNYASANTSAAGLHCGAGLSAGSFTAASNYQCDTTDVYTFVNGVTSLSGLKSTHRVNECAYHSSVTNNAYQVYFTYLSAS